MPGRVDLETWRVETGRLEKIFCKFFHINYY